MARRGDKPGTIVFDARRAERAERLGARAGSLDLQTAAGSDLDVSRGGIAAIVVDPRQGSVRRR